LFKPTGEFATQVNTFFAKLDTPIDTSTELGATGFSGRGQLALVGKVTTGMGLASFLIVLVSTSGRDRMITGIYSVVTTLVGLAFVAAGRTPGEKRNNLHNALMLITYWGADDRKEDNLHEYAYKEWAGMMRSFYKKRWEMYFAYLRHRLNGDAVPEPDFFSWERAWVEGREKTKL